MTILLSKFKKEIIMTTKNEISFEDGSSATITSKNFKISIASIGYPSSSSKTAEAELINLLTEEKLSVEYDISQERLIYKTQDMLDFLHVENLNNFVKTSDCFINSRMLDVSIEALSVIADITYTVVNDCNR